MSATAVYQNYFKQARLVRQSMRSLYGTFVIVEDDESLSQLISHILDRSHRKHQVTGDVNSAKQVIEDLGEHGVACVVIDISLPTESGIKLAKWLTDNHPDIPYFIYTGMPPKDVRDDLSYYDIETAEIIEKTSGVHTLMEALGIHD